MRTRKIPVKLGWLMIPALIGVSACCTFPSITDLSQEVIVSPQIDVSASDIGGGRVIQLTVVDERPRMILGARGAYGTGANLTVQGELAEIIRTALLKGLDANSFGTLAEADAEGRELRVEIKGLDYTVTTGWWSSRLTVSAALKAYCVRGFQRRYEQIYRGNVSKDIYAVPLAAANNAYVSQVVSEAVNALLRDQELLACLSE
jgi:hypothetical protein